MMHVYPQKLDHLVSFQDLRTSEEICIAHKLNNIEMEYTEADFQNLTTYKLFSQHLRPLLQKENPKVGHRWFWLSTQLNLF